MARALAGLGCARIRYHDLKAPEEELASAAARLGVTSTSDKQTLCAAADVGDLAEEDTLWAAVGPRIEAAAAAAERGTNPGGGESGDVASVSFEALVWVGWRARF